MMKLTLMKRFFDSVDEQWRSPIADEFAAKWIADEFEATCIRASANFAFLVKAGGRNFVLRLNHAGERERAAIAAEVAFIEHLAKAGIRVARPLPSLSGSLIEPHETPLGPFHAVLFETVPGDEREIEALAEADFRRWGRALAEVHDAAEGFRVEGRPDWSALLDSVRQIVPKSEVAIWKETDAATGLLRALPAHDQNYGLIHTDFELDNLRWAGDEIGLFDLDDCAYGWFAMDACNALSSDLFDDRIERLDLAEPRLMWFLEGYRAVRPLEEAEVSPMLLFLRLDNLVSFARVYRSIADAPDGPEPRWAIDLRQKLARRLEQIRQSCRDYPLAAPGSAVAELPRSRLSCR